MTTGATGYEIQYCSGVSCTPDMDVRLSDGSITTRTITGLTPNTQYTFKIRALKSGGENSKFSGSASATTLLQAPTNLRITGQTSTSLTLFWDQVVGADGYVIQYCDGSNCEPDTSVAINSGTTLTTTLSSLAERTDYLFRIKAVKTDLDSAYSDIIAGSTNVGAPTGLQASSKTDTSITLQWSATAGATGYTIQSCSGSGCTTFTDATTVTTLTTTIQSLTSNTLYRFRIKATKTNQDSDYSNPVDITTRLSTPTGLQSTAKTTTSVTLSWNATAGADGYTIEHCSGASCTPNQTETISGGATTKTFSSLTANTQYTFRIKATNSSDSSIESATSSPINVTTNLAIPSGLQSTSKTATSVSLSWSATAGATGYTIQYCDGDSCVPDETSTTTSTTATLSSLTSGNFIYI